MSGLHATIAFAEDIVAAKEAAVAATVAEKQKLADREKEARKACQQARVFLTHLRDALEAGSRIPEAAPLVTELDTDPADTLTQLGLRAGADDEPVLVEIHEPEPVATAMPFTPALDYPDAHPVEPPVADPEIERLLREGDPVGATVETPNVAPAPLTPGMLDAVTKPPIPVAKAAPAEAARPARPNAGKISALADHILTMFLQVRLSRFASLDAAELCDRTGKSPTAIRHAVDDLCERGFAQKAKTAPGHYTLKLLPPALELAA